MSTAQAEIKCPGCGAHIEVKATVPSGDLQLLAPEEWTAWYGDECPKAIKQAKIDVRFVGGVENYNFPAWSVQWAPESGEHRVAFYRRAVPPEMHPPRYTRWRPPSTQT